MKIPTRFKLLGATIEVIENPDLVREKDCYGLANYQQHKIELAPNNAALQCSDTFREQTFCHELAHFLCQASGGVINHHLNDFLHKNEEFVDLLGNCIHQVLDSMEYDK